MITPRIPLPVHLTVTKIPWVKRPIIQKPLESFANVLAFTEATSLMEIPRNHRVEMISDRAENSPGVIYLLTMIPPRPIWRAMLISIMSETQTRKCMGSGERGCLWVSKKAQFLFRQNPH
jgi:hypothetical protein